MRRRIRKVTTSAANATIGTMSRSFYVGDAIHQDDIHAKYEDGILKLSIPKKTKQEVEQTNYISIEG